MENKTDIKLLLAELFKRGILLVQIDYSGSGDEGSVNNVEIEKIKKMSAVPVITETEQATLREWAYEALDAAGVPDWCNNEGGCGTMHLNTAKGTAKIEHIAYETHEVESTHTVKKV